MWKELIELQELIESQKLMESKELKVLKESKELKEERDLKNSSETGWNFSMHWKKLKEEFFDDLVWEMVEYY